MMTVLAADLEVRKQVDVPADRDVTVDIDFPTGGRLSGRVTQGGKAVANRNIWMRPVGNKSDGKIAYSSAMTNRTITLRKSAGVEVRVQPGSRRFSRGFTITLSFPGNVVDQWIPMDREGACHVPRALAGTTFQIGRFSGEPIVIEEWDGEPFELP